MTNALINMFLLPFKLVALLLEILGRGLAVVLGLMAFAAGAFLCCLGPFVILGAPLCLLSGILVYKAL